MKSVNREAKLVQRPARDILIGMGIQTVHVPNGGYKLAGDAKARAITSSRLKADGLAPGFPDLIALDTKQPMDMGWLQWEGRRENIRFQMANLALIGQRAPFRVGFIECKVFDEPLGPEQEFWRDLLLCIGAPWAMIDQPEQVRQVVRDWGWR